MRTLSTLKIVLEDRPTNHFFKYRQPSLVRSPSCIHERPVKRGSYLIILSIAQYFAHGQARVDCTYYDKVSTALQVRNSQTFHVPEVSSHLL